jgi:ech hydrogenase subunit E
MPIAFRRDTAPINMARTVIPFGPQHPVLPEPIHLDLVVEDEKVVEARPSIGFIHRGLEKLAEQKDFIEFVYVAERICGICSFIHGQTYCQAVEDIMNIAVPPRALYLRTVWGELSRIHSHLLWLGLMADGMGFESLFMHSWRVREKVLNIVEATTGGRVIFGACKIGGVRRDMDAGTIQSLLKDLEAIERDMHEITKVFLEDRSVKDRLCGVGVLSEQEAYDLGCVGPTLRGSGVDQDMRQLGYAAFKDIQVEPVTRTEGDSYARCAVRCEELFQSAEIIRQALAKIPEGEIAVKITGNPTGETITRTEQPRGEVVYHLKANGTKNLQRFRVRTPTFANIPAMLKLLPGCDLADVPVLVLTIDPCISCTER